MACRHRQALARRLLDAPDLDLTPPNEAVNIAPDPGHIPALEDHRAANPSATRADIAPWLAANEPGEFIPFTAAQEAELAMRYAEDLTALEQGFADVVLLTVPEEAPE